MEATEYLPGANNGYGARLVVHSPDTYPFPADEGIFISSSMETSIGLKMVGTKHFLSFKPVITKTCLILTPVNPTFI